MSWRRVLLKDKPKKTYWHKNIQQTQTGRSGFALLHFPPHLGLLQPPSDLLTHTDYAPKNQYVAAENCGNCPSQRKLYQTDFDSSWTTVNLENRLSEKVSSWARSACPYLSMSSCFIRLACSFCIPSDTRIAALKRESCYQLQRAIK